MKKSLFPLLFAFVSTLSFAQETAPEIDCANFKGFAFEGKIGALHLNFDKLNNVLSANNVAIFEEQALHQRYAFRTRNKEKFSTLIGVEFIYGMDRDALGFNPDNQTFNTRNFTGYGIFTEYDFYILRKKWMELYPALGISFMRSSLKITDNIPPGYGFSNSIHSDVVTRKYSSWDMNANLDLNLKFKFHMLGALYHIGCYSGYRADFFEDEWRMDDNVPITLPKFNMRGFQWGIIVGAELDCERMKKYQLKKKEKKG